MNVDELTLLRELVVDEPMDDEAARDEVWRRLQRGETQRRAIARQGLEDPIEGEQEARLRSGLPRRRLLVLVTTALIVAVVTATAFGTVRDVVFGTPKLFARSTEWRNVDGIRFSFKVPRAHPPSSWPWENGPTECTGPNARVRCVFISKSTVGGQRAEAIIIWTSFPAGGGAAPCTAVVSSAIGRSTDALARAMVRAPGTRLVKGPTRVTVGGRPARHVVLTVRRDLGCDPGYFFTWHPSAPDGECWGACWLETNVGDTISVWIVDVDGKRLVIEAETRQPESQGFPLAIQVTRADVLKVEAEIEKIVGSIRFS